MLSGVREHSKLSNSAAQIRLRVAVHSGYVYHDDHGATGAALIHLFRLLEAPAFKAALADAASDFALIVSQYLYEEVLAYRTGLIEAAAFRPLAVPISDSYDRGWLWLPPLYSLTGPQVAASPVADRPASSN